MFSVASEKALPDIAQSQKPSVNGLLNWVGMENLSLPLKRGDRGVLAKAHIFVDLKDPQAKGIHMSRLLLALQGGLEDREVSGQGLRGLLDSFLESQDGLSQGARLQLFWGELVQRESLLTHKNGWKTYPVSCTAQLQGGKFQVELDFSLFYSSTCPCSTALSRQLFQQNFVKKFKTKETSLESVSDWLYEAPMVVPHSQRSRAQVRLNLGSLEGPIDFISYIDALEEELQTPVQVAVKREDEQEFARLNGENTMFVEDALRRMQKVVGQMDHVVSFEIKAYHYESLHSHDAVGVVCS